MDYSSLLHIYILLLLHKQQTIAAGDSITISWTGFDASHDVGVKICYAPEQTKDRKWRKFKYRVDENKQCKQTASAAAWLVGMEQRPEANVTVDLPINTAQSTYFVQVLSKSDDTYTAFANSMDDANYNTANTPDCSFTVSTYESQPTKLQGTMAFFCSFSVVVATVMFAYDRKKQNAIAEAWAQ